MSADVRSTAESFASATPAEIVAPVRGPVLWTFAAITFSVTGTLRFIYQYLDDVAHGDGDTFVTRSIEEGTGTLGAMLLFVAVVRFAWRFPLDRGVWRRNLLPHAVGLIVFSIAHTTLNWALRTIAFGVAGLGPYDYGRMPVRYAMEFGNDAIGYLTILIVVTCYRYYQVMRSRELRAAQLERGLAQAQLQNLRLQLQPHFLFNALNTISSTMYDDPRAADRMIGQLSELLRLSLRTTHTQEVRLAEELGVLAQYVGIMRARFGDALRVTVDVADDAASAMVPSLLLQPLVENAVRHGSVTRHGHGEIVVRARRSGGALEVEVADDGPGSPAGVDILERGDGLRSTIDRLRLLYGDADDFWAGNAAGGGFVARIRIPFRSGEPSAAELIDITVAPRDATSMAPA